MVAPVSVGCRHGQLGAGQEAEAELGQAAHQQRREARVQQLLDGLGGLGGGSQRGQLGLRQADGGSGLLGVVCEPRCTAADVLLLFTVIGDGQVVVLHLRAAAAGQWDDPHPGHEQGKVAGVDVAQRAQQTVHSFFQGRVARQRHGPTVQQPGRK